MESPLAKLSGPTSVIRIDIALWTLDIGLLMQTVTVTKRGADRLRQGHLSIYRSDVLDAAQASGGSVVGIRDQKGNFVGQALFSDSSEITLRLLTQSAEPSIENGGDGVSNRPRPGVRTLVKTQMSTASFIPKVISFLR